jgi:hypothetical protein
MRNPDAHQAGANHRYLGQIQHLFLSPIVASTGAGAWPDAAVTGCVRGWTPPRVTDQPPSSWADSTGILNGLANKILCSERYSDVY